MLTFEELSKTVEAETEGEAWDQYYTNLHYTLTHPQPHSEIIESLKTQLNELNITESLIENGIMNEYYETGETGKVDTETLEKLTQISEEKRELETLLHNTLIEYYATYEGAKELREKIRELKSQYPKNKPLILENMKHFHDSENFHKKQIIAALITDAHKKSSSSEFKLLTEIHKVSSPEGKKKLKQWLKKETKDFLGDEISNALVASTNIVGFRNYVDLESLDYKGKWFTVLNDNGVQFMHAEIPEWFKTTVSTVPDLTLFKEHLVGQLVVLRRLKKRGLASEAELDLLQKIEYNNKMLSEFKKVGR